MKKFSIALCAAALLSACQTTGNYEERAASLQGMNKKVFEEMVRLDTKYCVIVHTRGSVPERTTKPRATRHYGLLNESVSFSGWYSLGILDGKVDDNIYANPAENRFICGSNMMREKFPQVYNSQFSPVS